MLKRGILFLFLFALGCWVSGQTAVPTESQGLSTLKFSDLQAYHGIFGLISPDGKTVLYTIEEIDRTSDELHYTTWKIAFQGGAAIQMTQEANKDRSFQWRPDSAAFSFLGERYKEKGLYLINSDGGEPVKLFNHEEGINQYLWSPDGRRLAFLAKDKLPEQEDKLKQEKKDAIVEDEVFQMNHLWIFDCQSKKEERLTGGDDFSIMLL